MQRKSPKRVVFFTLTRRVFINEIYFINNETDVSLKT